MGNSKITESKIRIDVLEQWRVDYEQRMTIKPHIKKDYQFHFK